MGEKIGLILEFGTELASILIGMIMLFGGKLRRVWIVAIGTFAYVFFVCFNGVPYSEEWIEQVGFIGATLVWIISFLTIYPEGTKKIRWLIIRLLIIAYIDELLYMCINDILYLCGINTGNRLYLIENSVMLIIVLIAAILYKKYKAFFHDLKFTLVIRKSMIPMLAFFACEIMALTIWIDVLLEDRQEERYHLLGIVLTLLSMISIGIFVIMVLYVKKSNEQMEQMLVLEKQMKQSQRDYYETLLEKETETRRYRHDMNSHFICLNRFANDGDVDGVKEYIREMKLHLEQIQQITVQTGIETLDILLNHYCTHLPEDTDVTVKGKCHNTIDVSDMEQCMIFSNLIKNAVEAIQQVKQSRKILKIHIVQGKDYVQFVIINSIDEQNLCIDSDGNLQTTKEDKRNHGIGLFNVKEAVNRNGGKMSYYIENQEFKCEVYLPVKKLK